jgi:hypothetical protein
MQKLHLGDSYDAPLMERILSGPPGQAQKTVGIRTEPTSTIWICRFSCHSHPAKPMYFVLEIEMGRQEACPLLERIERMKK